MGSTPRCYGALFAAWGRLIISIEYDNKNKKGGIVCKLAGCTRNIRP